MRERIATGEWQPGQQLPPENVLAAEFGVGRATMRGALLMLTQDGLIHRQQGVGSFVSESSAPMVAGLERLEAFTETMRQAGLEVEERILSMTPVFIDDDICRELDYPLGTPGLQVTTLRLGNQEPVIWSVETVPLHHVDGVDFRALRQQQSILEIFDKHCGKPIRSAYLRLEAIPADAEVAACLQVEPGSPLLSLAGIGFGDRGRPIYHSRNLVRTDRYYFTVLRR